MGITLRCLGGATEFSQAFMSRLPLLEQEMVSHDFDPDDFTFEKVIAASLPLPMLFAMEPLPVVSYEYTVKVNDSIFTVTLSGDLNFLAYFSTLCFSTDEPAENRLLALFTKAKHWFETDPFKE